MTKNEAVPVMLCPAFFPAFAKLGSATEMRVLSCLVQLADRWGSTVMLDPAARAYVTRNLGITPQVLGRAVVALVRSGLLLRLYSCGDGGRVSALRDGYILNPFMLWAGDAHARACIVWSFDPDAGDVIVPEGEALSVVSTSPAPGSGTGGGSTEKKS